MMFPSRLFLPLLFVVALMLSPLSASEAAQYEEGGIEWLAHKFLKERNPGSMARYYTGDLRLYGNRPTPGATYHDSKYDLEMRVNEQDETSAAVAATLIDRKANQQTDFYLFLRHDDHGWKLASVRNFGTPRGVGQVYAALAAKGKDVDARDMRELALLQVLQYNDWAMKQRFEQRRAIFDQIAVDLKRLGVPDVIHGGQPTDRVDRAVWERVRDSLLNYVQLQENGSVELNAASFGQSAVGYLWVPPSGSPPRASPENYILVEPLDGPWYLYRRQ
jgi:hypothetical protein